MKNMSEKIRLVKYDHEKHGELLEKWKYDEGVFSSSVENYDKFGLLGVYENIVQIADVYDAPIKTDSEITKTFVVFDGFGEDVGIVVLNHTRYPGDVKILSVFHIIIRPDEQGRGFGSSVMNHVISDCEKLMGRGVDLIYTAVDKRNEPSKHMMEKIGFRGVHDDDKFQIFEFNLKEKREEIVFQGIENIKV